MSHDTERLLRSLRLRRPSASLDRRVLRELRRNRSQRWTAWMATASAVAATIAMVLATAAFMQSGQQPPSQAELADERAAPPAHDDDRREVHRDRPDTGREASLGERGLGGDPAFPRDGHPLDRPLGSSASEPVNGSQPLNGSRHDGRSIQPTQPRLEPAFPPRPQSGLPEPEQQ